MTVKPRSSCHVLQGRPAFRMSVPQSFERLQASTAWSSLASSSGLAIRDPREPRAAAAARRAARSGLADVPKGSWRNRRAARKPGDGILPTCHGQAAVAAGSGRRRTGSASHEALPWPGRPAWMIVADIARLDGDHPRRPPGGCPHANERTRFRLMPGPGTSWHVMPHPAQAGRAGPGRGPRSGHRSGRRVATLDAPRAGRPDRTLRASCPSVPTLGWLAWPSSGADSRKSDSWRTGSTSRPSGLNGNPILTLRIRRCRPAPHKCGVKSGNRTPYVA